MSEAEADPAPTQAQSEPLKQIDLKTGDYKIHIFIEEGRALLPPKGGETTDPILSIQAFDQIKSSDPLEDIGSSSTVYWGEHFFFEKKNATHEDLEDDKITISVLDHNTLFKDSLVGVYELDLIYVYTQPSHAIIHTWVVLSNPQDENFDQMRGYLKVGVSVLHHDDIAVDLAIKEKMTSKDKDLLLPPHVKPQVVQLILHLLKAENLPVMDKGETLDAYGLAKFAGAECKSSVYEADRATLSAYWYDEILIPVMLPCVTKTFTMMFWDRDVMSSDDLVGSFNLNFNDIKRGKYEDFFWANIYGAHALLDNDEAESMNTIPETASCWRGRVLLKAWVIETDETVFKKVQKIKEENIALLVRDNFEVGAEFEIRAMAYAGTALPIAKGEYELEISWSGETMISQPVATTNGNVDWYENLKRKIVLIPTAAEKVLPDVFVYLIHKEKRICFTRIKPQELMNVHAKGTWLSLMPDKAVGVIKDEWNAGFVKVRIYIGGFDEDNDNLKVGDWKSKIIKPPMQSLVLLNHIFQCAELPSSDKNGLADPYIRIYFGGNEVSTKEHPKECTLNPKWYETFPLSIEIPSVEDAPPIVIYLYDYDAISENDIMGIAVITLEEASNNLELHPKPKWYKLGLGNSICEGKILASFTLAPPSQVPRFDITPEFVDKSVEINILGLRDLKPAVGWLPVNKAFVKIDLNSLDLPDSSQGVSLIETQPFESGNNPNINTCLSFRCKIPKDPIFAPTLTCQVCDYLFAGLSQPLIGTFAINIGEFMKRKGKTLPEERKGGIMKIIGGEDIKSSTQEEEDFLSLRGSIESSSEMVEIQEKKAFDKRAKDLIEVEEAYREGKIKILPRFAEKAGKLKEFDFPNPEQYMSIGWNREPDDGLKHYRFFLKTEYEKSELATTPAFDVFKIIKGQNRGVSDSKSTIKSTGKMKAKIRVSDYPPPAKRPLSFIKDAVTNIMSGEEEFDNISRALLSKIKCVVRVYIMDAFDLEQKDRQSQSDPFLRLKLGKQVLNFQDEHQEDTPNPSFMKMCEFSASLPGVTMLKIQLWDYDSVFSNEKIGTTKIDLEDRFFSLVWKSMEEKVIETRPLYHASSRVPQGYIRLWVEIFEEGSIPEPIDITPKPPSNFEARLIIWGCKGVESQDFEGVSDLFVRAYLKPGEDKETDTHYRAQSGKGSWNWRMKFPLELPCESNLLTVQLWDRDILSVNDWIGEITLPFNELAEEAFEDNLRTKMTGESGSLKERMLNKEVENFWIDMTKRNEDGEFENVGKLEISFELVPENRALACPVGEGRENPNVDPYLPPPIGRFEFSLNPLKMISELCGPEFKAKICCAICCILCLALLIFIAPNFISDMIANSITS